MNEPTQEIQKEFWEWCGWKEILGKERWWYEKFKETNHWWEAPNGRRYVDLPSLKGIEALGSLFEWAVPKLWVAEDARYSEPTTRVLQYPVVKLLPISKGHGDLGYIWNCFLIIVKIDPYNLGRSETRKEIHTTDEDPALALFRAVQPIIALDSIIGGKQKQGVTK